MQIVASVLALGAFVSSVSAMACAETVYSTRQIEIAAQKAFTYHNNKMSLGSFPTTYDNADNFAFEVPGPYLQFPLLYQGVYDGGAAGSDFIIFNGKGDFAGVITTSGAVDTAFVACE